MSVFMFLVHKIAFDTCNDWDIQFAYDFGAIDKTQMKKLFNLKKNIYFGKVTIGELKNKLSNLLASESLTDETVFEE